MSTDNSLSIILRLKPLNMVLLALTAAVVGSLLMGVNSAYADDGEGGSYTVLETASANTWRIYAKSGETIHFNLHNGIHHDDPAGGGVDRCVYIYIANSAGTRLSTKKYTCNSSDNVINGDTTATYAVTSTVTSMSGAYKAILDPAVGANTNDNGDVQGYEWHIWVTDTVTGAVKTGRVWFDGDKGLKTWQYNAEKELTSNVTTFNFTYARLDGYRYRVKYKDYQGIWSEFHGGIYGVNKLDGTPAYTSTNQGNPNYQDYDTSLGANKAYVYVDCGENLDLSCPSEMPTGTRTSPVDNPITAPGHTDGSGNADGFRFTGSTTSLVGRQVIIPYKYMQSGYIRMSIYRNTTNTTVGATLVCEIKTKIDNPNPDASTNVTWTWPSSNDNNCTGTLKTSAMTTLSSGDYLIFQAEAFHRGEMHFLSVDDEKRGGIDVRGSTSVGGSYNTSIIWYDPFSRRQADTCGAIPPRIGAGSPGAPATGSATPFSESSLLWLSTSSLGASGVNRPGVNSSGGVHGWTSDDTLYGEDTCYASDESTHKGHANDDGTATDISTWGNNRVIEDWTYDGGISTAFSISIGGPSYTLTPTVTSPSTQVVSSQNPVFEYSVSNNTSSSNDTSWSIRSIIVPPGMSLPSDYRNGFDGTGRTCASYYAASPRGAVTCNDALASGSGKFPGTFIADETVVNTYAVGTLICRSLTVDSYNQNSSPNARTSALTCVMVTALPYVSVIGGSIWSGGSTDATTGYANNSGKIEGSSTISAGFGSFGEYDLFATNSINFFGSSARPGPASATSGAADGTGLTFGSATSLGSFSTSHKITDLVASLCNGVLGNNTTNFAGSNDEVIHAGEHQIKCFDALNIKKNITYDPAGATSFGQLPSLIVVANRIEIDGSVTQIAGNFYAAESFVTCAEGPRNSADKTNSGKITTSGSCTNRLTINGSVTVAGQAVNSLVLNRSYGGTTTGEAAETIRMRPEVFLTPYENSLLLTTVSETELPARY